MLTYIQVNSFPQVTAVGVLTYATLGLCD